MQTRPKFIMFQQVMQHVRRTTIRTIVTGTVVIGTLEVTTHLPSQGRSSKLYHYLVDDWGTPLLRRFLNPEMAHNLALELAQRGLAPTHRPSAIEQRVDVSSKLWNNKHIPNCIGLAAGFDKDGLAISPMFDLGFGFIEIGSVCLKPQPGNPSPRMFRLVEDEGVINRYGFNSMGVDAVEENLQAFRQRDNKDETTTWFSFLQSLLFANSSPPAGLVGINLGRNKACTTPVKDYQTLIRRLGPYADYLVINLSCPNVNMEDLKATSSVEELLQACQQERDQLPEPKLPVLVKLSPDLDDAELQEMVKIFMNLKIDGIILTNTTTQRPSSLVSANRSEIGGLSGRPLQQRSTECIRNVYKWTKGSIPIIGVGGVLDGKDVYEKLKAGASLVQVYSGMVYRGPGMVSKIRHELAELMLQNGQRRLQDVIGLDHEDLYWTLRQNELKKAETTIAIDEEGVVNDT